MSYIEMKNSYKIYNEGKKNEIIANNDISFAIEKGKLAIILGNSGAGKSTILNILGGMDQYQGAGNYRWKGYFQL